MYSFAHASIERWLIAVALIGSGCGGKNSPAGFGSESGSGGSGTGSGSSFGGSSGTSSNSSGATGFGSSGSTANNGNDCASGIGQYIYVISDENNLYAFDPTKVPSMSAFALIGPVACAGGDSVNSMAVDRQGTAWVNYTGGGIFKVTTSSPVTCQSTSFAPNQGGFTNELGMGFSSDAAGSSAETLFVSDNDGPGGHGVVGGGKGLAKIDLSTMTLTPLGGYTGANMGFNAELTGTSDGKLYGFFTTTPANLAEIEKTTGATPSPLSLPTVNASTGGYAFSFWGGDFYFYTQYNTPTTTVTHFHTATGVAVDVMTDIGFTIVGAGVSTCAPRMGAPAL